MKFTIKDIPQADRLEKVILAVEAVYAGASADTEIAEEIGFTARQARYYRHAAVILGFIQNQSNHATITLKGTELAEALPDDKIALVRRAILKNNLFQQIVIFFESKKTSITDSDLIFFLLSILDTAADSDQATINRRTRTIFSWLVTVDLIVEEGEGFRYNEVLEPSLDEQDEEKEAYPSNYTQEVDIKEERFSVFELLRKIDAKKIRMNPDFQRNLVWKAAQKSQFIESIILNVPLPPFYFRKEIDGKYTVVDGLQRTSTLNDFIDPDSESNFSLTGLQALPELNGKFFIELSDELKTRIEDKNLLMYVLQPSVPMVIVYDIFNRINTGGTKLNPQEIRNCIFIGEATTLLKRISESKIFRDSINGGISPIRMKDREAILRCLSFQIFDPQTHYNNSMNDFLEKGMKAINRMSKRDIMMLETKFMMTLKTTNEFFGKENFRLPTNYSMGRISIAIMETVTHFFANSNIDHLKNNKNKVKSNYERLLKDGEYLESVRYSTNSTFKVKTRFQKAQLILSEI
jgi:uncharacterized protein with ParB-like and HNH nuclease domain